jgi:uncharacterized protein YccT (UPF0319 family)
MGKKSKFKKIRRIASQMPLINTHKIEKERVAGAEVIASGVTEVDGKPVEAKENYIRRKAVPVPINHNRQMKRLYNKHGAAGVGMYIGAVNKYMEKQAENNSLTP